MVKLIAFDMDGTLLRCGGLVSGYTLKVLSKCKERGILLAMVTARSNGSAQSYIDAIKPDIIITNGGATGYYKGCMVYERMMSPINCKNLTKLAIGDDGVDYIRFVSLGGCFSNEPDYTRPHWYKYTDFSDFVISSACKISLQAKAPLFIEPYQDISPMNDIAAFSGKLIYKISHKEALKKLALASIAQECGIDLSSEAVAFGDDVLDIGMLSAVMHSVAVDNALASVKAVAAHICESNDNDGVAKYIDEFVLL